MLAKNQALTDDSDTSSTSERTVVESKDLSQVSANTEHFLDFHHCGQEIENVVVLSIN